MSIYDYSDRPAYRNDNWATYTNRDIDKWWTAQHDKVIEELIEKWQWQWYWKVSDVLVKITPEDVLSSLTTQQAWYSKVMNYAITRAKFQGIDKKIRRPEWKVCPLCNQKFVEDSLPHPLMERLGVSHLDFCAPCLRDILLQGTGNKNASKEDVIQYIVDLTEVSQRIPSQSFGIGINDIKNLDPNERLAVLEVLRRKPTTERVREIFGSWFKALIESGVIGSDSQKMSRGIKCLAKDGHVCLSLGEKTIDDYLHANGIPHDKEPPYPSSNYKADFHVLNILIEYFGLTGNPEYDAKTREKQKICKEQNIILISIFPVDLANDKKLETKLRPAIEAFQNNA